MFFNEQCDHFPLNHEYGREFICFMDVFSKILASFQSFPASSVDKITIKSQS